MAKETKAKSDEWTPMGVGIGVTIVALIMAYIILISTFIAKVYDPKGTPEITASTLGQLGDYVGGLMNPVLAFLTFIGAVATVYYAYRQYEAQAQAVSQQREIDMLTTKVKAIEALMGVADRQRKRYASDVAADPASVFFESKWQAAEDALARAIEETTEELFRTQYNSPDHKR